MESFRTYSSVVGNVNIDADIQAIMTNPYDSRLSIQLKNMNIRNTCYLNNVNVENTFSYYNSPYFDNNIFIVGNVNQIEDYYRYGDLNQSGDINLSNSFNLTGGNFNLIGSINNAGNVNRQGVLNLSGNNNHFGPLNIKENLNLNGNQNIFSNSFLTGNLNITGSISMTGGNLFLKQDEYHIGTINIYGSINNQNLTIRGNTNQSGTMNLFQNTYVTGNVNQTGNHNLVGSANFVSENVYLQGNINQTGIYKLDGRAQVAYSSSNDSVLISDLNIQSGNSNVVIGNFNYSDISVTLDKVVNIGNNNRTSSPGDLSCTFIGTNILSNHSFSINDGVFIGTNILTNNATISNFDNSVIIGASNLVNYIGNSTTKNIIIGANVLSSTFSSNLFENLFIGSDNFELFSSSNSMNSNVCIGTNICQSITSTFNNTLVSKNTMIGNDILDSMNFNSSNTNNFEKNTFVGTLIGGQNKSTNYIDVRSNTVIGDESTYQNTNLNQLTSNTIIGQAALYSNSSTMIVFESVIIGSLSMYNTTNVSNVYNSVFVGTNSNPQNSTNDPVFNRIGIGSNSLVTANHSCILGVTGSVSTRQTRLGIGITEPETFLHIKSSVNATDVNRSFLKTEDVNYPGRYPVEIKTDGIHFDQQSETLKLYNIPLNIYMNTAISAQFQLYNGASPRSDFVNVGIKMYRAGNLVLFWIGEILLDLGVIGVISDRLVLISDPLPAEFRPSADRPQINYPGLWLTAREASGPGFIYDIIVDSTGGIVVYDIANGSEINHSFKMKSTAFTWIADPIPA